MSVREAKAQFSSAVAAAERGERVTVTRHGKPVATIGPVVAQAAGVDWAKAQEIRNRLNIAPVGRLSLDAFNDPVFSRTVLGLED